MKKYLTRALTFLVCMSVILAGLPFIFTGAAPADETQAIEDLKTAWLALSGEAVEVFAIPQADLRQETTEQTAITMNTTSDKLGPYYVDTDFTGGGFLYCAPDGTTNFGSMSKYTKLQFWFMPHSAGTGTTGKLNFQMNGSIAGQKDRWDETNTWKSVEILPAFCEGNITRVKFMKTSGDAASIRVGSVMGYYTATGELPSDTVGWTGTDWVNAAVALDLSVYDDTTDFNAKLLTLKIIMGMASAEEAQAIETLKTAWLGLSGEVRELWAIPAVKNNTTPAIAAAMGTTEEQIGPYYLQATWSGVSEAFFSPANGTGTYDSLSKYSSISFRFQNLDADGITVKNNTNFMLQLNHQEDTYPYQSSNPAQNYTLNNTTSSGKFAPYFSGTKAVTNVKAKKSNEVAILRMGCIFGHYTAVGELPENTAGWSAEDWITAAGDLDLSIFDDLTDFEAALRALRAFSDKGSAHNALVDAWKGLETNFTELWAIPNATIRIETTDVIAAAMGVTTDKLGPYYIEHTLSGGAATYTAPNGTTAFTSLKKYSKITFTFLGYTAELTNPGESKFELQVNNGNGQFPSHWSSSAQTHSIQSNNSQLAAFFAGTSAVTGVKAQNAGGNTKILRMGCIFGHYTGAPNLPEGYVNMSLRDLTELAEELDLTGMIAGVSDFEDALENARFWSKYVSPAESDLLKSNLLDSWSELKREVSEVWAIPAEANQIATTQQAADEMGISIDSLGPYYINHTWPSAAVNFTAPDGTYGYTPLTKYSKICFAFLSYTDASSVASESKLNFQINHSLNIFPAHTSTTAQIHTIYSNNATLAPFFNGTSTITNAKIMSGGGPPIIKMGSIFGYFIEYAEIPEGAENMTLPALCLYAADLNSADYDEPYATAFEAAREAAQDAADLMRESAENKLWKEWEDTGLTLPADNTNLLADAMELDISSAADPQEFLDSLYTLRTYTKEGAIVDALKTAWEDTGLALPEGFAQLSTGDWIDEAKALDISNVNEPEAEAFTYALNRLIDYYTTGKADADALVNLVEKAEMLKSQDFVQSGFLEFKKQLQIAQNIITNLAISSQRNVDEVQAALLTAWGELRVLDRYIYLDLNDYYINEPDISATFNPQNSLITYDEIIKDEVFPNGLDRAVKLTNFAPADSYINFGNKALPSLKSFEFLEFYLMVNEDFDFTEGGKIQIQLMNQGGQNWADYYVSFDKTYARGEWLQVQIPIDTARITIGGVLQTTLMSEIDFSVSRYRVQILNGKGDLYFSSVAAVKTLPVEAGKVIVAKPVNTDRPVVIEPEKPKNPFTGIDRGDPWGDAERKTAAQQAGKPGEITGEADDIPNTNTGDSFTLVPALIAMLLSAGVMLVLLRRKRI